MATYTGSATELKTCRNGSSWRASYPYARQGRTYSYDTAANIGHIGFNFNLLNTAISSIVLKCTFLDAGIGSWYTKNLCFYKNRGVCTPASYTDSYKLGSITSTGMHNCTTTWTLNSTTNKELFAAMAAYFQAGNNVLIICKPEDTKTESYGNYTDNYLAISAVEITINYEPTYNMDVNYKVNGTQTGYYSGYETAGTFDAVVGGTTVADDALDLNYRAVSGTSYKVTANPASGWRLVNNSVAGTNKKVEGTYPSNDFSVVLDFREEYTITYNNGGGGTKPSNQTKVNGTALTLRGAMTRPNTSPGNYTVSLVPQNGEDNSTLTATRTTSYTFLKWKSTAGIEYSGGGSYSTESATTMTAQWSSNTVTSAVTLPTLTKPGYAFMGWSTSPNATTGVSGNYVPSGNVTLYGIWAPEGLVNIDDGSSFNPHTIWIDNGTSWDQYMAYLDTGTEWVLCNE